MSTWKTGKSWREKLREEIFLINERGAMKKKTASKMSSWSGSGGG